MMKLKNKIGQQFGNLIVDSINKEKTTNKHTYYNCHCLCGNPAIIIKRSDNLTDNSSCGCRPRHKVSQKSIDTLITHNKNLETKLIGQKFGRLTVLEYAGKIPKYCNANLWKCQCECGNITYVTTSSLQSGHTKSCGCLHSYREMIIANFLKENYISFQQEFSFSDLFNPCTGGYLRYDFALFNKNQQLIGLIEYNGEQHYNPDSSWYSETQVMRDEYKIEYSKKHNIPLLILDQNNFSDELILDFYNRNTGG